MDIVDIGVVDAVGVAGFEQAALTFVDDTAAAAAVMAVVVAIAR